jgi:hypothetical protein
MAERWRAGRKRAEKFLRAGIVLETGTATTVDIKLDIGQLAETVNCGSAYGASLRRHGNHESPER